ncbi:MAG: phenylacetate--CoA ligase [Clostridiales bacterium]|nr:MAG: phenylacetate--CoA ligase [Clostridiales bacterium]
MEMNNETLEQIKNQIRRLKACDGFYSKKLKGIEVDDIKSQSDFEKLPFSEKNDLREAYPLGLSAVPESEIVRIHSSSGTTGTPVIIPYTQKDVDDWAELFRRCYEIAGITVNDRIQITTGYGLWTAGIGFQLGAEKLGAMVIPMGPGNTEKQLKFMEDMQSTVFCATSSYALLLAEEVEKHGLREKIHLKKGIIGSERWGEKMRTRISETLGVELFDIYGLTEVYGPGLAINCEHNTGMHYFNDYLYFEIINPKTGEVLPEGELGELVITTLKKEGAPLIRYRTHDLTRFIPGECPCGRKYPRIDVILGRTDDMVKVKGVIIFPGQVDKILKEIDGASSEYQVFIDHPNGRDIVTVFVETALTGEERLGFEKILADCFKSQIGLTIVPKAVSIGELPRSEKKSTRIFDYRY